MKNFIIGVVGVLTVVLILFLWLTNSFTMFEVQEEMLASHSLPGKNFKIEIKRVAAGATTSDVIQVVKVYSDGTLEVLKIIDGYSDLISSNLIVKSSGKPKLGQSTKNLRYTESMNKKYVLYMPKATDT
jgi:hypothetical protein